MSTPTLFQRVREYLTSYMVFSDPAHADIAALWAITTHAWPTFDAFPYLCITSETKRSGKSRLMELLSYVSANARVMTGMTPATLFRSIRDESPVLMIDEAESENSETSEMRAYLNSGYRRGTFVRRTGPKGIVEWPLYCPKVFVLIGDVNSTLRDRSVVIRLRRGEPAKRFVFMAAQAEGHAIRDAIADAVKDAEGTLSLTYADHKGLPFLTDRDEEIWTPMFTIAEVLAPEALAQLPRMAVDMSTEKTAPARSFRSNATAEADIEEAEYCERLVKHLSGLMVKAPEMAKGNGRYLATMEALTQLRALATAPWRKYRGPDGLTVAMMASMLERFSIVSRNVRVGDKVLKAYVSAEVDAAMERLGKQNAEALRLQAVEERDQ